MLKYFFYKKVDYIYCHGCLSGAAEGNVSDRNYGTRESF